MTMYIEATKNGIRLVALATLAGGIYGARQAMRAIGRRLARVG